MPQFYDQRLLVSLVRVYLLHEVLTHGDGIAHAEFVIDSLPRHGLLLLEECQHAVALALELGLADGCLGLQKGTQHALLCGARTDDVGSDAVDTAVEEVQTVVHTVESIGAYNLGEQFLRGVIHYRHVVTVPAHGAADVQHQFRNELQHGAHLVGRTLGGVIMTCVNGKYLLVLCGVGGIEVV